MIILCEGAITASAFGNQRRGRELAVYTVSTVNTILWLDSARLPFLLSGIVIL
jgi:hypothetical protein